MKKKGRQRLLFLVCKSLANSYTRTKRSSRFSIWIFQRQHQQQCTFEFLCPFIWLYNGTQTHIHKLWFEKEPWSWLCCHEPLYPFLVHSKVTSSRTVISHLLSVICLVFVCSHCCYYSPGWVCVCVNSHDLNMKQTLLKQTQTTTKTAVADKKGQKKITKKRQEKMTAQ